MNVLKKIKKFFLAHEWLIYVGIPVLIVLVIAGFILKNTLFQPPELITVDYSVSTPAGHDYDFNVIKPLTIQFHGSVAPLDQVEMEVKEGIELTPEIPGQWIWDTEDQLSFTPIEDWPIGTEFKVRLSPDLFPEQYTITNLSFSFETDPFTADFTSSEFYIDPTDSSVKRILVTMQFNYPVKTKQLEELLSIHPDLKSDSGTLINKDYDFNITYDDNFLEAYIVSEPVGMPADDIDMMITLEKGLTSSLGGDGIKQVLRHSNIIPGINNYIRINSIFHTLVRNKNQTYDQVLSIDTKGETSIQELSRNIEAYQLPIDRPAMPGIREAKNYRWDTDYVTPEILEMSEKLTLQALPTEREYTSFSSFQFHADPGTYIYVKINGGTKFYGGYYLSQDQAATMKVKQYPKSIEIMSEGSLLALSGEKKLTVLCRGIDKLQFEVGRIIPSEINHLISQSNGNITNLQFQNYFFDYDNITEKEYLSRILAMRGPNEIQYTSFDFSPYLQRIASKNLEYGLFILNVYEIDSRNRRTSIQDRRLIMVTDLGILVKGNYDGSKDLFVQSISTGFPVAGAKVEVIGKNGNPVATGYTTGTGHVKFETLSSFSREHQPTAYVVSRGNDLSFLPYSGSGRYLDYSGFDIGGVHGADDPDKITGYMFSDRGIYRPGEEIRLGMIVKSGDWTAEMEGTPFLVSIQDPRGNEVYTKQIRLSRTGFEECSFTTQGYSPTGSYTATLFLLKDDRYRQYVTSSSVKVEEFLPDRLKIDTSFSVLPEKGWIKPDNLRGIVRLKNLFGTAAEGNYVEAEMGLSPGYTTFRDYSDYRFFDPYLKDNSYREYLGETETDETGKAEFFLDMSRFEQATYRVSFFATAFEKGGGREVSSESTILVSPMDYLLGLKADGDTSYINKGSQRNIDIIALDHTLTPVGVDNLSLVINEIRYVSVLVKQQNGVYKYQSVKKNYPVTVTPFAVPAGGKQISLPTKDPGDYSVSIVDAEGLELNSLNYSVVGAENISRSLDRTAELEIKLNGSDFKAGEIIDVFIKAPYTGAGLITIERDQVYAYSWFKTTRQATTQQIRIPPGIEGNAYVNVAFIRSQDSPEVYMSPLSYGVQPFSISKDSRTNVIELSVPEEAKPGEEYPITFSTSREGKIVIFAVDEGILQVANYTMPDPVGYFFKKRALEVNTIQILDLILPEYSVVRSVTAMGGGEFGEEALSKNLNPFKRGEVEPVAFWSGIIDAGPEEQTVYYPVPGHFNGSLRVMAVAVSDEAVGAARESSLIKDTFIMTPNVPTFAAPGDEFEVSVNITNNYKHSGNSPSISFSAGSSSNLQVIGGSQSVTIPELGEKTVSFTVKVLDSLGPGEITCTSSYQGEQSTLTSTLSVRPPVPYRVDLHTGIAERREESVSLDRIVYDEFAKRELSVSYLPSGMAKGLIEYLGSYPYGCTEQIVSASFPMLYPSFVAVNGKSVEEIREAVESAVSIVMARQKSDGSFGLWTSVSRTYPFISCYSMHFLTEAREQGYYISETMYNRGLEQLRTIADSDASSYHGFRNRAYAVYLLTRNEIITTSYIEKLTGDLKNGFEGWETDLTGIYLAGAYGLMQQNFEARTILGKVKREMKDEWFDSVYSSKLARMGQYLAILSDHFPERLTTVSGELLTGISDEYKYGRYTTYATSYSLMGIDAYIQQKPIELEGDYTITAVLQSAAEQQLKLFKNEGRPFMETEFPADIREIQLKNNESSPLFYQILYAGFDTRGPEKAVKEGIEVIREYLIDGKVIDGTEDPLKVGDEVEVRIRLRSTSSDYIDNIAVVDLLPGGLEADFESIRSGDTGTMDTDYVDTREDRIVIFTLADSEIGEFVYKARAIAQGTFTVPPAYAEAMYDREIFSYSPGGSLIIQPREQ